MTFTYYNQYDGDYAPEYDIELQVSYDGGDTWKTKWTSDYQDGLNQLLTETVDLGIGTEESFIRWYYPAVETDDEGAYDHSSFTLDSVPIEFRAKARRVPSWTIDEYGFCGILPEENAAKADKLEEVTLVPMGAARLRISAFPTTKE